MKRTGIERNRLVRRRRDWEVNVSCHNSARVGCEPCHQVIVKTRLPLRAASLGVATSFRLFVKS